jgi:hypothetical protein
VFMWEYASKSGYATHIILYMVMLAEIRSPCSSALCANSGIKNRPHP